MGLKFCAIASGSTGNCYFVQSKETLLLVDVGISGKRIVEGLEEIGIEPEDLNGILLTHEHTDHIKSVRVMMKKSVHADLYTNIGTWEFVKDKVPEDRQILFETDRRFVLGDIEVYPFAISHDARDPVGFTFCHGGKTVTLLTDTGCVNDHMVEAVQDADLLVLEANHDEEILKFCSYPYEVKKRILSDRGHLSNETAARFLCDIMKKKEKNRSVLLAHLSKENNTPHIAKLTVENQLDQEGIPRERFLNLRVLSPKENSEVYIVE